MADLVILKYDLTAMKALIASKLIMKQISTCHNGVTLAPLDRVFLHCVF